MVDFLNLPVCAYKRHVMALRAADIGLLPDHGKTRSVVLRYFV